MSTPTSLRIKRDATSPPAGLLGSAMISAAMYHSTLRLLRVCSRLNSVSTGRGGMLVRSHSELPQQSKPWFKIQSLSAGSRLVAILQPGDSGGGHYRHLMNVMQSDFNGTTG